MDASALEKPMVMMSREELKELVREAIREEKQSPSKPELMSTEEVADLIGCTPDSIRTYCSRDSLPCVRIGKLRRFHRTDVLEWLEARRSQPRAHKVRHLQAIANVRVHSK